jgi:biotin carboxylase
MLREYLHVAGMGETTARAFRDKLAMRNRARSAGIPCPEFVHVLNQETVDAWANRVRPPWVMKPRSQAAAIGIRKINSPQELAEATDRLGDNHGEVLLEQFVPGTVYHVDSIVFDRRVRFAVASRYRTPPMSVAHEGGIFVTQTLDESDPAAKALEALNARVLDSFGLRRGASHTEFIRGADDQWYFLETSARVGGAYIVDVVEAATGINLWSEWAKVEVAGENGSYDLPPVRRRSAGIILSLARQEHPDTVAYDDPEVVTRIKKRHHAGLILAAPNAQRITELLDSYAGRFYTDFHASAPPPERALD